MYMFVSFCARLACCTCRRTLAPCPAPTAWYRMHTRLLAPQHPSCFLQCKPGLLLLHYERNRRSNLQDDRRRGASMGQVSRSHSPLGQHRVPAPLLSVQEGLHQLYRGQAGPVGPGRFTKAKPSRLRVRNSTLLQQQACSLACLAWGKLLSCDVSGWFLLGEADRLSAALTVALHFPSTRGSVFWPHCHAS